MKILGKDVSVSIETPGSPPTFELIGCSRTCTLTTTVDIAGKSTLGSGTWKEFKGVMNSWTVEVEGLTTFDENMDMKTLRQLQFQLVPIIISFQEVAAGNSATYAGYAIITNVSTSGNFADAETFNLSLQGTGELLIDTAIFGAAPDGFEISGQFGDTTLTFIWTVPGWPVPDSYHIRQTDLNTGIITIFTAPPADFDGYDIAVDSDHHYTFEIQSVYSGFGESLYSSSISWP